MIDFLTFIIDLLFPKQCINCGKYGRYVCKFCNNKYIFPISEISCHVCKKPILIDINTSIHDKCKKRSTLLGVYSCIKYSKLAKKLIQEVKYALYFDVINEITDIMISCIDLNYVKNSIFVPVPLFKFKERKRGFNQTMLIAKSLRKKLIKLGVETEIIQLIKRERNTKTQVGMSRIERKQNLKSAFALNKNKLQNLSDRKIILIDDVFTTGTTLEECSRVLYLNRIKNVYGLTFARA